MKIKTKTKLFSVFIKTLLHVKHECSMQHDNLQKFPNATSITSREELAKTLAVPVITFILTPEWDQWGLGQTEKYK